MNNDFQDDFNNISEILKKIFIIYGYDNLSLMFDILGDILTISQNRVNKINIDFKTWQCNIKGISYMPSEPIDENFIKIKNSIEQNLQKLKAKN